MKRNEKGFTGIEIAIAVVLIFIFVSIISTLIYNIRSESKEVELRGEATTIAVEKMEEIKSKDFEEIIKIKNNPDSYPKEVFGKEGYYYTVNFIDYADLEKNQGKADIKRDVVVKAEVIVEYQNKGKTQNVTLETVLVDDEGE